MKSRSTALLKIDRMFVYVWRITESEKFKASLFR